MRRVMLLALLALALSTAALANPITVNFGVVHVGGVPSYTGSTLESSTAFDFGNGTLFVSIKGPGDQSGLTAGDQVNIVPRTVTYGSGDSGSITPFSKTWTDSLGSFSETFTSFTANRNLTNGIQLTFSGTISGPGGVNGEAISMIVSADQVGGPGTATSWSATEIAHGVTPIPEPGTLGLLGTGLISLAALTKRKFKLWI